MKRRNAIKVIGASLALTQLTGASSVINIGRGNGNSVNTQQFFNRLITPPTGALEAYYSELIDGLTVDGTWAKLDGLWVAIGALDEASALTNLVADTFRPFDDQGFPSSGSHTAWSTSLGFQPTGAADILNLHFNPSTAAGYFSQNSAHFFVGNLQATMNAPQIGVDISGSTTATSVWARQGSNSNHTVYGCNQASWSDGGALVAVSNGLFLVNRSASNALTLDLNGTQIATSSAASQAMDNGPFALSGNNSQIWCWGYGSSLTSTQRTLIAQRLRNFGLSVGVSV